MGVGEFGTAQITKTMSRNIFQGYLTPSSFPVLLQNETTYVHGDF